MKARYALLGLLIAGCGGSASVSTNLFAGTWSGTGTWQQYDSGGTPLGSPATNIPTSGTVSPTGQIDIKMQFGPGSSNIYDNMKGSVNDAGVASGAYWDAVNQDGSGGNLNSYTAVFSRSTNHVDVSYVEQYGSGTVRGTYSLTLQ